ncbi:hypothetical protein ACQY0O_007217 [Thecaphora frezii]
MCGRFANGQPLPAYRRSIAEQLPRSPPPTVAPCAPYRASYNVAPHSCCLVLRRNASSGSDSSLHLDAMVWGLVPRNTHGGAGWNTINARDDTLASSRLWSPLLEANRCVLFCQGFYEWQKKPLPDQGEKVERVAHFIGMAQSGSGRVDIEGRQKRLMPLAALYSTDQEGKRSFTIITTQANDQLRFLHDRMPVILADAGSIEQWIGMAGEPWKQVRHLVHPYRGELECYKVPKEVGKVGNDDPKFLHPIETRKDGVAAFFQRQKHATRNDEKRFDDETLKVTREVEEDVTDAHVAAELERKQLRELSDRRLAQQLQRQWDHEQASPLPPPPVKKEPGEGVKRELDEANLVGNGSAVPQSQLVRQGSAKRRRFSPSPPAADARDRGPSGSSRFSPDPFDPPISPPRPSGGYSRPHDNDGASPSSKRTKTAPRPKQVESGPLDSLLSKQREAAKRLPLPPKTPEKRPASPHRQHSSLKKDSAAKTHDIRSFFAKKV